MGDLLGSFPRKCASEDKTHWKDLSWFVGLVVIPESSHSDVGRHMMQPLNPSLVA